MTTLTRSDARLDERTNSRSTAAGRQHVAEQFATKFPAVLRRSLIGRILFPVWANQFPVRLRREFACQVIDVTLRNRHQIQPGGRFRANFPVFSLLPGNAPPETGSAELRRQPRIRGIRRPRPERRRAPHSAGLCGRGDWRPPELGLSWRSWAPSLQCRFSNLRNLPGSGRDRCAFRRGQFAFGAHGAVER